MLLDLASIEYLCVITLVIHRNILVVTVVVSQLKSQPRGNDIMNKISDKIKSGSRAFLVTEYKYLSVFVISMFLLLFILYAVDPLSTGQWTDGVRYGLSFLTGAMLSAVAGWAGMLPQPMPMFGRRKPPPRMAFPRRCELPSRVVCCNKRLHGIRY